MNYAILLASILMTNDAAPVEGALCELEKPVRVSAAARGRGKKARLKKGTILSLVRREVRWSVVQVEGEKRYVKSKALDKRCTWTPPDAETPLEVVTPEVEDEELAIEDIAPPVTPEPTEAASANEEDERVEAAALPIASPFTSGGSSADSDLIPVAIMNLQGSEGIDETLITSLSGVISEELDQLGAFRPITTEEIRQMLEFEASKQSLGCSDMSCLAEIGGALGVDYIITGTVASVTGSYLIQLQLTDIKRAKSVERVAREYQGDLPGLVEEMRAASRKAVNDLLESRAGRLAVPVSEEGATVRVDGAIVGVSPLAPVRVAGGARTVQVEKEGFIRFSQDVTVQKDQELRVDVTLVPSAEFVRRYREEVSRERALGWVTLGVGAAALAVAGTTYAIALSDSSTLGDDIDAFNAQAVRATNEFDALSSREDDVATLNLVSVISAAVGLAGVGVGSYLLATSDDPDRYDAEGSFSISAAPTTGGGMFVLTIFP
ncbi:MAG: PEGA domain-containing protein [Myxococcota bacterium]